MQKSESVAGSNEIKFSNYFKKKFGKDVLEGKCTFETLDKNVSISVDNSLKLGNKEILIEIDSGNMAKLIVGQYVLLNELYKNRDKEILFLIIHFYKNQKGKEYNPIRTERNLSLVSESIYGNEAIKYKVFNQSSFKELCQQCKSIEDFVNYLYL
ncbi:MULTISPECIES: hypothetical protein [Bacillus]|uniref:hypothetical protein n=1 Tax=Bacillus TaxID=1386 RepID=UPI000B433C98|nr:MULTISPECIES: hypothetical protein [Bacillus cereus group]OTY11293.1 hypothetical protein BK731_00565 [Bacillus thuringiensis serovar muju]PFL77110.1 hypothetical protein COJ31_25895 [Bacillus cereus]